MYDVDMALYYCDNEFATVQVVCNSYLSSAVQYMYMPLACYMFAPTADRFDWAIATDQKGQQLDCNTG